MFIVFSEQLNRECCGVKEKVINMVATESAENYLEAILVLSKEKPVVRSVDVSNHTGFRKSSISIAMKNLKAEGYITISPEGYIYLTDSGMRYCFPHRRRGKENRRHRPDSL